MGPVRALSYLPTYGLLSAALAVSFSLKLPWAVSVPLGAAARVAGQLSYIVLSSWVANENLLALVLNNAYLTLVSCRHGEDLFSKHRHVLIRNWQDIFSLSPQGLRCAAPRQSPGTRLEPQRVAQRSVSSPLAGLLVRMDWHLWRTLLHGSGRHPGLHAGHQCHILRLHDAPALYPLVARAGLQHAPGAEVPAKHPGTIAPGARQEARVIGLSAAYRGSKV